MASRSCRRRTAVAEAASLISVTVPPARVRQRTISSGIALIATNSLPIRSAETILSGSVKATSPTLLAHRVGGIG